MQNNKLTGSIPESLFLNMTSVEDLRCHGNSLTGSISSAIEKLHDLTLFSAHDNSISGTIPGAIGCIKYLSEC